MRFCFWQPAQPKRNPKQTQTTKSSNLPNLKVVDEARKTSPQQQTKQKHTTTVSP
jgi:hypothetical protein